MATLLRADNTAEDLPCGPDGLTLQQLHDAVGGYIEFVYLDRRILPWVVLICDEDGLCNERPINHVASALAGQQIVGDVVVAHVYDPGEDNERIL